MASCPIVPIASLGCSLAQKPRATRWRYVTAALAASLALLAARGQAAATSFGAAKEARDSRLWLYEAPRSKFMVMSSAYASQNNGLHGFNHFCVMAHLGHQLARVHKLPLAWQRFMLYFGAAHDLTKATAGIAKKIGLSFRDLQLPEVFSVTNEKDLQRFKLLPSGKGLTIVDRTTSKRDYFEATELDPRFDRDQQAEHDRAFATAPEVPDTAAEFERQWHPNVSPEDLSLDLVAFSRFHPLALDLVGGPGAEPEDVQREQLRHLDNAFLWRSQTGFAKHDKAKSEYQKALSHLPMATQEIASQLAPEFSFLDHGFAPILTARVWWLPIMLKHGFLREQLGEEPSREQWRKFIAGEKGKLPGEKGQSGDIPYALRVTNNKDFYDVDIKLADNARPKRERISQTPILHDFLQSFDGWTSDVGLTNVAFMMRLERLMQIDGAVRKAVVNLPFDRSVLVKLPPELRSLAEETQRGYPKNEYLPEGRIMQQARELLP